jgi:GNAT superfamily N-acetyltransferase
MQEIASVAALSHIFPQDRYPFPRAALTADWAAQIADPGIAVLVVSRGGRIEAFAALRDDELFHFGTALATWGSGLAARVHDELIGRWTAGGHASVWLRVFEQNHRARRFYEKMGWAATPEISRGDYPPFPPLRHYRLALPPTSRPRP